MTATNTYTNSKQPTGAEKLRNAERTRDDLGAALRALGVVLPSLSVEALAYADENPDPLLDLGRCSVPMAHKLLAVLQKASVQ